ncbi:VOC family protein [Candidatus Acetothermia bacterium]|jgi:predicted enzyme related to lactoylglutathione lyase|nr:VOC family protein [Candidatus Acetothermia bacterium]MCI2431921.1 VOC family protein [Candidatus Acetothermia bacterium]MCI2437346.1 VOC family protein [Candidatus Acetothermia bacterium]
MAKHGICHIEWASTDLKRTQAFYGGLFGWTFEAWGDSYVLFKCPDGFGGGFAKQKEVRAGRSPLVYVQVDEIEPYLKKAKELGGGVADPKTQIDPSVGWYAHLTDPDGNIVGLFQSARK